MAAYEYSALDANGRERKGVQEADSVRQLRQVLRDRGLSPLRVEPTRPESGNRGRTAFFQGVGTLDRALFTRQLATLIGAGIPIDEALSAVAQQSEKRKVRSLLMSVRARVLEGRSLAASLAEQPSSFPRIYSATVAAGEHSGHLDRVLESLADYSEQEQTSRQNIQMAMLYPVILSVVALVIGMGLMTYVVPRMVAVFEDSGQALPLVTRAVMGLSKFLANWYGLVVLAMVCAVLGARWALSRPELRRRWHRWLLTVPFIGRVVRGSNAAQLSSTLSMLTSSGVPVVEGMRVGGEVLSNEFIRERVNLAVQRVSEGASLHTALSEVGYFPPLMLHMIASGEASGELDNMLARVAKQQQNEIERLVTMAVRLFEPIMLLVMAGVVLTIVMAILLPIIQMNDLVAR